MKDYFQRILLVFPETRYPSGQPPLGLGMLVAIGRNLREGHEVRIAVLANDWSG